MGEAQANRPDAPPAHSGATAMFGAGDLGRLVRDHDWGATPLGPIDGWSGALRGNVDTILAAPVPIVLFWGPDHVAFYNDACAPTLGDAHPRALGRPARDGWAELWDDLGPMLDRVRAGESIGARDRPLHFRRPDHGTQMFPALSCSPARDGDGRVQGVLCLLAEATGRTHAPQRAVAERERLKDMFEQAPGFMALLAEPGHVFEYANAALRQLIGPRDLIGRAAGEVLPELVEQGLLDVLDQVVRSGRPFQGRNLPVELRRGRDGRTEQRLLNFIYQPVLDDGGRISGIFVEGTDVTARARAEERAALSEDTVRLATEVVGLGTWDWDIAAGTLAWNDATKAMFGIAPDAPCSVADFHAGIHPDDRSATLDAFAAMTDPARRLAYDVEYRTVARDGVVRWVAAKGRAMFDGGRCLRAVGIAIDITARRRTQDALRESEERFRVAADSAPALIWMCDETGRLVFVNRWHEETFGRPAAALIEAGWPGLLHPDEVDAYQAEIDAAFALRRPLGRDLRIVDRHGATRWLHSEARPRFAMGRFAGYVGCDVDITETHLASEALERRVAERTGELAASNRQLSAQIEERERVEATLRQMQRLEAVGQLTSGVAHDFNNLLTVILGNLDMVSRAAAGPAGLDERTIRRLETMRVAAERGATLTKQLLAFSRRQRLEARAIDLADSIAAMRELLGSVMGGSVRLDTAAAPDLWPALVDPTQIELIILNLAINARDAMAVGGTLRVDAANVTLGEPGRPEEPPPGDYVMIAVADSGTGMTPEVLAKAFEPFFTTKEVGKGSGLGLPQVYGFAKQSGGGVGIETAPGHGTTVRVYLPRAGAQHGKAVPVPPRGDADAAPRAGGRRVLLVDDDAPVREVTAAALAAMGATVVEAASGAAALVLLDAGGDAFDLLVADFAMPGMNGAELAAAAGRRWPALPVLYVTGYADLSAIATVSEERIVQKPFRPADLQAKVARLLAD